MKGKYMIDKILEYNKNMKKDGKQSFSYKIGKIPVLLSAPHSVEHLREGNLKIAEEETGAIVQIIAELANCSCIYKTYNNNDDANYDIERNEYKEKIIEIIKDNNIKVLIDMHGASNKHEFDIEIGTDNNKNLNGNNEILDLLIRKLKNNGIEKIYVDSRFKASSIHTICKYVSSNVNIPCIQMEIVGKYRYKDYHEGIQKLVNAIKEFIQEIQ